MEKPFSSLENVEEKLVEGSVAYSVVARRSHEASAFGVALRDAAGPC